MTAKQRDPERERFWRAAMAAQQASGLTVRAYCQLHRLAETAFHHWRVELRRRDAKPAVRPVPSAAAFVPVAVVPAATPAAVARAEVRCPSGHVVTLPADAATLRTLFAALRPLAEEPSC